MNAVRLGSAWQAATSHASEDGKQDRLDSHLVCRWPVKPEPSVLSAVAAAAPGFAGADLKALCAAAVVQAARRALKGADRAANEAALGQMEVHTLLLLAVLCADLAISWCWHLKLQHLLWVEPKACSAD